MNALKNNQVDVVYIFDSEGGTLVDFFKKEGIDLNDYIKPNKDIFGKYVVEESYTKASKEADAMSMALA